MQTYNEIVQSVQAELMTAEGMRLMGIRRKAVYDIAKIMPEFRERMRQLRSKMAQDDFYETERELTELTVNQSTLKSAIKGDFLANMEICGKNSGTLTLPPIDSDEAAQYFPYKSQSAMMVWGTDEARKYITMRADEIRKENLNDSRSSQPEHLRKKRLVEYLLGNPKAEEIKGLQLLLPAGCNMEIPTAINSKGQITIKSKGGHIDMIFKIGADDAPTLVIGELKDMRDNTTTPFQVLRQAIIYAAALGAEINGLEMDGQKMGPAKKDAYATFFDIPESAFQKPIGVAAIIPNHPGTKDGVRDAMKRLAIGDRVFAEVILYEAEA